MSGKRRTLGIDSSACHEWTAHSHTRIDVEVLRDEAEGIIRAKPKSEED